MYLQQPHPSPPPKFTYENHIGKIKDPEVNKIHKGTFDSWVVCSDESVKYLPPEAPEAPDVYTSFHVYSKEEEKENHVFLLNSTIASMFAIPIGWRPINHTELVSPVLTLGNSFEHDHVAAKTTKNQIDYVFKHLTKQTPPAPMFFHNTTTSTHVHMSILKGEKKLKFSWTHSIY